MNKMIVALVAATLGLSTAAVAQTTPPAPTSSDTGGFGFGGTTLSDTTLAGIGLGVLGLGLIVSSDDESGTTTTTTTN